MTKTIIAGQDLYAALQAEKAARVAHSPAGFSSEPLCQWQREVSSRGVLGAELVDTIYGWSVRYDSGLQNFGLLASSRARQVAGTLESAEAWATNWVAQDPARRYAWKRAS